MLSRALQGPGVGEVASVLDRAETVAVQEPAAGRVRGVDAGQKDPSRGRAECVVDGECEHLVGKASAFWGHHASAQIVSDGHGHEKAHRDSVGNGRAREVGGASMNERGSDGSVFVLAEDEAPLPAARVTGCVTKVRAQDAFCFEGERLGMVSRLLRARAH